MNIWEMLGFENNPYNTRPLQPRKEDIDLLVGRKEESILFLSSIESKKDGVCVISGAPGVGKTSFFNIQQYQLETGGAPFGNKILSTRTLCSIQPNDNPRELALRILKCLHKSIEQYCSVYQRNIPQKIKEIGRWLGTSGNANFEIGLQIMGFGGNFSRNVSLPSINNVTFEGIQDAIECIVDTVVNEFKFDGVFIALDNTENLDDKKLSEMLVSYRDTLFLIPCVWWVLIGQSGLGSLIRPIEPKVFERITGSGIELKPISLEELYIAVEKRVQRFRKENSGNAPLSSGVHRHLYNASHGEIRSVFKYCESICINFISSVRAEILRKITVITNKKLMKSLGSYLVRNQIDEKMAEALLMTITKQEIDGLNLRPKDKSILKKIGQIGSARPRDYELFSFKSYQDFYSNYLNKLYAQNLLVREQEGKAVRYRLRGLSSLAAEFKLL